MAEKRMFSKTIIDSDAFLEMPSPAQALYFHLGMRADDEGFVNNPKKIQRIMGASDDDLKLLIAKQFVLTFESGVIVIKHWKLQNCIRADRIKKTVYEDEKSLLETKENGAYTFKNDICQADVRQMSGRCPHRLDKIRLDKISIDIYDDLFNQFWAEYPKKVGKGAAKKIWLKIKPNNELTYKMIKAVEKIRYSPQWTKDGGQFIPNPATWLNQERWEDEPTENKNYDKEFAEWTL